MGDYDIVDYNNFENPFYRFKSFEIDIDKDLKKFIIEKTRDDVCEYFLRIMPVILDNIEEDMKK